MASQQADNTMEFAATSEKQQVHVVFAHIEVPVPLRGSGLSTKLAAVSVFVHKFLFRSVLTIN